MCDDERDLQILRLEGLAQPPYERIYIAGAVDMPFFAPPFPDLPDPVSVEGLRLDFQRIRDMEKQAARREEAEGEIKLSCEKPVGAPIHDVKRFYLDTVVSTVCPVCGATCSQNLAECPLTYPEYNVPFTWTSYCDECNHEWQSKAQLILHVELQVVPGEETNDPVVSESDRTIQGTE